ncbi:uncharacterized protein LOC135359223 isoform X2 [Latimeria chalumnae]|uniref:uncharacterized protein LOC135359223 isoform X2 n=1 Tax=Latimeria chalumnae TaxID=7897 RepID=UPI00313A7660
MIHLHRGLLRHGVFCSLLFLLCVEADMETLECNTTSPIPCKAAAVLGVQYRKVSWYKVRHDEDLISLVLRDLWKNQTFLYKSVKKPYSIAEDMSLIIPDIEAEDAGVYRCMLWAPVGERMQNGELSVQISGTAWAVVVQASPHCSTRVPQLFPGGTTFTGLC